MNKRKGIYLIAGIISCVLCVVIISVNIDKNKSEDKSSSNITINENIESLSGDSVNSSASTEVDDASYFANLQDNEEKDKEYETGHGNEVMPYESFEKGGVKYTFKDIRCISDVDSIPDIIPDYNEKYRVDTELYMSRPLAEREKEGKLVMICYVFEVENTGSVEIEYNPFCTVMLDVTDENGYIVGGVSENFYLNGDDEKLNTSSASKINLKPGESRELVFCMYNDTTDAWEGQEGQQVSWDDQLVFYVYVTSMGQAVDDVNIIQEKTGIRYFEIFRGSLNEFSTYSRTQGEM